MKRWSSGICTNMNPRPISAKYASAARNTGAGSAGRPRRTSGQTTMTPTSTVAIPASVISVRVAMQVAAHDAGAAEIDVRKPQRGERPEQIEEERPPVGRRTEVEHRIACRRREIAGRGRTRRCAGIDRQPGPTRASPEGRNRIRRPAARGWSRSESVNGEAETISVATFSRVTSSRCRRGAATPASNSAATPSESNRVVSDTFPGSNQRDTLKTPVGVRELRKTRQPSRV